MSRYYEDKLPPSNYHGDLETVALGTNNHAEAVYLDDSNEYGLRLLIKCWSEHDEDPHWYSVRDHKGDVFVAEVEKPPGWDAADWQLVWREPRPRYDDEELDTELADPPSRDAPPGG